MPKKAKILYDKLREDRAESTLFERMKQTCPSYYGMSEFSRCKFKRENIADSYECLQCWTCKEHCDE